MNHPKTRKTPQPPRFLLLKTSLFATLSLGLATPLVRAQQVQVDASTLNALEKRIDDLETQVKALKAQAAAPMAPVPTAASNAPAAPALEAAPAATYPMINFHGFGDVDYEYASHSSQFPNHFYLGELDFYVTSQISENTSIISENVLSADPVVNNWTLEAERLILDYKANDWLNLQAGRFHTQLGYYNTAFHHGTWLQNDTHRPWFLEFEDSGGILPVHMVGVSADGDIPSGSTNLHYFLQLGNGRSYDAPASPSNPTQAVHVDDGRKAVNLALVAKPDWAPGFEFDAGAYHQVVSPQAYTGPSLPSAAEYIYNLSVIYSGKGWNFMNEGFLITHKPTGGTVHTTEAGYTELSRNIGKWTPYTRYTYVNSPVSDPVYNLIQTTGLRYGPTLGLRYDFDPFACVKVQYDQFTERDTQEFLTNDDEAGVPDSAVTFQVGFTF